MGHFYVAGDAISTSEYPHAFADNGRIANRYILSVVKFDGAEAAITVKLAYYAVKTRCNDVHDFLNSSCAKGLKILVKNIDNDAVYTHYLCEVNNPVA